MPKSRDIGAREKAERKRLRQAKRQSDLPQDPFLTIPKREDKTPLKAKTEAQGQLISTILTKDITFAVGPAGTGKTFVSASLAAEKLLNKEIEQIVITRPMLGCEEDMGFLPGEEEEKYAPWVEPVMDVLNERLGKRYVADLVKNERIVCKPLQFMRGKSFRDCWVLMDEAQNTTPKQMKMFLTRLGQNAKMIIDGDIDQSDLFDKRGQPIVSGLEDALSRLRGIPEVGVVEFTRDDCVRHDLTRKILDRY